MPFVDAGNEAPRPPKPAEGIGNVPEHGPGQTVSLVNGRWVVDKPSILSRFKKKFSGKSRADQTGTEPVQSPFPKPQSKEYVAPKAQVVASPGTSSEPSVRGALGNLFRALFSSWFGLKSGKVLMPLLGGVAVTVVAIGVDSEGGGRTAEGIMLGGLGVSFLWLVTNLASKKV